jgi:hypothetical protein
MSEESSGETESLESEQEAVGTSSVTSESETEAAPDVGTAKGCLAVFVLIFLSGFVFIASSLSSALARELPVWPAFIIGTTVALVVMAVILVIPNDPPDKVIHLFVALIMTLCFLPMHDRRIINMEQKKALTSIHVTKD